MQIFGVFATIASYHYAVWPYAANRFVVFKSFLKKCKRFPEKSSFKAVMNYVKSAIDFKRHDKWRVSIPAGKLELKSLRQTLKILEKLEKDANERKEKKKNGSHLVSRQ